MVAQLMKPVYAIATHTVSALGMDVAAHWENVVAKQTGIQLHTEEALSPVPFYGSRISPDQWEVIETNTKSKSLRSRFEQMCIYTGQQALAQLPSGLDLSDTVLILSTTKGNIEWLDHVPEERLTLHSSAEVIAQALNLPDRPIVISHACISGVAATTYAQRVLQAGRFKHALVLGADRFTRFVLSGFQSFQAVADEPCKPFDAHRKGINLGEAAAAIVLSTEPQHAPLAQLLAGSTSNDANHISGPSRTGEELALAIRRALFEASLDPSQIDMISAHGTATLYNDEMESKAFALADLTHAAVHSFKGYTGHTLGAAGVVESAMIIESIRRQQLIPSAGFSELGVSQPLHITQAAEKADIRYVLKTASGFGGCNAAAIWGKL